MGFSDWYSGLPKGGDGSGGNAGGTGKTYGGLRNS
jgi:hypothetical protein